MNGSKNNVANRGTQKVSLCPHCNGEIKPVMFIRAGKRRMIGTCKCAYQINSTADLKVVLG